ncbi:four-carbon acid sugar kinase family protein [Pluralibacter gergoviae]|uniref:four-carbon acid sugar kinase family protein n=1 Tax=Pluralibacter gergoviae TaxID=61647 RepID=UPI0027EB214A|nr:four-carbon acid sugar kinase family protein [Pluralibacter gergoviae]ELC3015244.1 four-carbon acid sugar kinase family protein [Pluralibacter gergoviae]ELC3020223.1 four-carbon acid sugar kinase family protein [Pluralibacter gergoviae]ELG9928119.1 four-carbon acid sugar kinase family protein [Pluralibacter gergoviae]ELK5592510.1 four-carbon acid sugar kinase family protein [Pluralibacter gergoviae]
MKVAIIADDLTGANATAALLSTRGFTTLTCLDNPQSGEDYDVISFSTDSRSVPAREAYERVSRYLELVNPDTTTISKRIDSTLRGNLGAEVDAVIDRYPHLMAIVVPVYPSSGRICVGGSLLVDGIPLQNTAMRNDPKNPMTESSVIALFRQQTNKSVGYIPLSQVLKGERELAQQLKDLYQKNVRIVVMDATTDEDIHCIAAAVLKAKVPFFCVDPGVFTAHLAYMHYASGRKRANKIFVAIGSVSELTQRQIKKLRYERQVSIQTLSAEALIDIALHPEQGSPIASGIIETTRQYDVVGIDTVELPEHVCCLKSLAKKYALDEHGISLLINQGIAEVTAQVLGAENSPISALYSSGGDVVVAITRRLKGNGVILKDEVEPLTVYGHLTGGLCRGVPVITKGGFVGDDNTLVHCIDYLATKVSTQKSAAEIA